MAAVGGRRRAAPRARPLDASRGARRRCLAVDPRGGRCGTFDSLPDARFARDPRCGGHLPRARGADGGAGATELWLAWESGARPGSPRRARLRAARGRPPPRRPAETAPGGEVIDRAVLADRRARRAEAAEREQARLAAEALRARRGAGAPRVRARAAAGGAAGGPRRSRPRRRHAGARARGRAVRGAGGGSGARAGARLRGRGRRRLRGELDEQRCARRKAELLRAADAVALAAASARRRGPPSWRRRWRNGGGAGRRGRARRAGRGAGRARPGAGGGRRGRGARAVLGGRDGAGRDREQLEQLRIAHAEASAAAEERQSDLAAIGAELGGAGGLEAVRGEAARRSAEAEAAAGPLDAGAGRRAHGARPAAAAELAEARAPD